MSVGAEIGRSLSAYFKAQFRNAVVVTLLYIVGFAIAGVPWWALTGLLSGILNLVPQIGPILVLAFALFVRFLGDGGWIPLAYVTAVWLGVQILDGFVLSPRAASHSGVNPWLSIVLVFAGGALFGPLGMILAVPVAAVALIVIRAARRR